MDESPKPVLVELEYSGPRAPDPLPPVRSDSLFRFTLGSNYLVAILLAALSGFP